MVSPGSSASRHAAGNHSIIRRGTAIVSPLQVEHHRRAPPARDPSDHGLLPLDGATLARLRQMRWREPTLERRRRWLALLLAASLHAVFVVGTWHAMRPRVATSTTVDAPQVLQVRFIARAPTRAAEPPPPPVAPPPPPRTPPKRREPPSKDAMIVQSPPAQAAAALQLYDEHGQPRLPATAASAPEPGYVANLPQGDAHVMQHADPIQYKATRFESDFPPPGETAGGAAVRHVVGAVVKTKEVNLPGGVHLKCKTILGIPIPACTMPPAPPSAKDGDERLSMAPARSLDGEAHAPAPPSVEACIAMYRAGKPLAWGCPVDTPNRSVDAELRERAAAARRTQP